MVSLLPARNAAADLPGHLESVARFADTVVALDDGSTDDTRAILEAHPLVHTVLTNPRREGYAGWDDSANRNRLLAAALDLAPAWVVSLDADELLAADDAAALRAFLAHGADPDDAYLLPVLRMIGDLDHYAGEPLWVGRLFAPVPGHVFPSDRLHFVPIPTAIPRSRWRRTTFRIQHRGALTPERRRARLAKYREADPNHEWQGSYDHLLHVPDRTRLWYPRGALLPAVAHQPVEDSEPLAPGEPAISVVIIGRHDEARILRAVTAATRQELDDPFEVIVVTSGGERIAEAVRAASPGVTVIALDGPALPGQARNAGLRVARGRWVTFPGSHVELAPGSLAARLAAHRAGHPVVAGAMTSAPPHRPSAVASHLALYCHRLPGRPAGPVDPTDPAAHGLSYDRPVLDRLGPFDPHVLVGEDTAAARRLGELGVPIWFEPRVRTAHRGPTGTRAMLADHHRRGRVAAQAAGPSARQGSRLRRAMALPAATAVISAQTAAAAWRNGRGERARLVVTLPWLVAAVAASLAGRYRERRRGDR